MKIEIETSEDDTDCETCGSSYASGGRVIVDGVEILNRPPHAHCYDGVHFDPDELLVMALKKLGHVVLVDGSPYHVTRSDDEYHNNQVDGGQGV